MNQNSDINNLEFLSGDTEIDENMSVDDFIRALEEREKDLHITSDASVIEIADDDGIESLPTITLEPAAVPPLKEAAAMPPSAATVPAPPAPAVDVPVNGSEGKLQAEVKELKQSLRKLEVERSEIILASQRRAKDFENYKARTERERTDTFQNQLVNLATLMLPVLDNLNRAVDFSGDIPEDVPDEVRHFLDGIVIVSQQVHEVLAAMGILPIATVGEEFDPYYHEAVATDESGEYPDGTVCAELQKGYRIGNRVIRHSMVKVSKPPAAEQAG